MSERRNERTARHIVSQALGVPVERFEDGRAPSQVDAVIRYIDGRTAALEVVADHEDAFNAQWDALSRIGHRVPVPGTGRAWSARLSRRAKVRDVARNLPGIVAQLNDRPDASEACDRLDRLGVTRLEPLGADTSRPPGYVYLHPEGWGGVAGTVEEVSAFVERVLVDQADVPSKLAAHPADEGHAFIWTTIGSDYGVQFALENREQPLPTRGPGLPAEVTHVWVAGSFSSQGALAWFPDRGWWRVEWNWPPDGLPLELSD